MHSKLTELLTNNYIQVPLGIFLTTFCSGMIAWDTRWEHWLDYSTRFNSLVTIFFVQIASHVSIRQFTQYMGNLSFRFILPISLFWLGLGLGVLFIFRIDYSVYYIACSSFLLVMFFCFIAYVQNTYNTKIIGYILSEKTNKLPYVKSITWKELTTTATLDKGQIDAVMADLHSDLSKEWEKFLADCTLNHIPVYHSPRLLEALSGRLKIDHMYENELGSLLPSKSYQTIKRVIDMGLIVISLPLTLPIMCITALLIKMESKGEVFFLQERIGQGGMPFHVYKFRSMRYDSEKRGSQFAQEDDIRVTKVGKFIRKTRIDELPQFWNVIKGEMSLIGPRPEQKAFVDTFSETIPFYNYRHIVKPGISGWAQVVQGYTADEDATKTKLEYDFYYIKNFSFSLDLLVFLKTIQTILTGFGAR